MFSVRGHKEYLLSIPYRPICARYFVLADTYLFIYTVYHYCTLIIKHNTGVFTGLIMHNTV